MINKLINLTIFSAALLVLLACSFNSTKKTSEYKRESKRCGQKYW